MVNWVVRSHENGFTHIRLSWYSVSGSRSWLGNIGTGEICPRVELIPYKELLDITITYETHLPL